MLNTSIHPSGRFRVGVHRPSYTVANLRQHDSLCTLGLDTDGKEINNYKNFPCGDVEVTQARSIYEICNPFAFRGCTFIDAVWADARAANPAAIRLHPPAEVSLRALLGQHSSPDSVREIIKQLPLPLRYQLATSSSDPEELTWLAQSCCRLLFNAQGQPTGLQYSSAQGQAQPEIDDFELFETIANNPALPDAYKDVMVLRPGAQGGSEIVGDFRQEHTEVFEYLRSNSYIPYGHFAANCAPTTIRYRIADLSATDMEGLRHLYYQRVFFIIAQHLGIAPEQRRHPLHADALETLRQTIIAHLSSAPARLDALATLWGWNFGYDFSGSGYRLHASHQMIHQQYALVSQWVEDRQGKRISAYSCGDLVADVIERYRQKYHSDFFTDYLRALTNNTRTDGGAGEQSLVVWQDTHVLVFVPKAQVSQWELNLMVIANNDTEPVGNVLEADTAVRRSLDTGILKAQQILAGLGASMVTTIEYSKRIGLTNGQRLLYAFLPKLPFAMGGFSEAQGRFILGHYPEDFAVACRRQLAPPVKPVA
jgi:hypothetical protein